MMPALDHWVVSNVLDHIEQSSGGDMPDQAQHHFINLSGSTLSEPSFFDFVRQQLADSKVPANRICFEITETAAIANLQRSVNFIKGIRNLGCHFALDDFGSGLSSFSYLKAIPVDYLKIDGNFVRDIANDDMDRAIVEAINNIGHVVGLSTIAEFVESEEVFEALKDIGVDYAQGYHLGRPEPIDK
jgi:Amt family ammonium transporter